MRTIALAAVAALGLAAATPAKADFWFGGPGFSVGFGAGPGFYGGPYYAAGWGLGPHYGWGGGPYYAGGWGGGYYGDGYYRPRYWGGPYAATVGFGSYAAEPGYSSYAYAPGYQRCRTVIIESPTASSDAYAGAIEIEWQPAELGPAELR